MRPGTMTSWARAVALGVAALSVAGCSRKIDEIFRENLPPEVRLTQAPVSAQDRAFYAYRMSWVGYDPDGRVDYFLYAVDPPTSTLSGDPDTLKTLKGRWTRTTRNEQIVFFRARDPELLPPDNPGGPPKFTGRATDFHTFAIVAVDDKGEVSRPVWRSFTSFTVAPTVSIEAPSPNAVFTTIVTPSVRVRWRGVDPDGQFTTKPLRYKYRLFGPRNPDFPGIPDFISHVLRTPDFLREAYGPSFGPFGPDDPNCPKCAAWDSVGGDTTEVQYTNLIPQTVYLFAVTGFDEAGAYDPIFSASSNLLRFAVSYAGTQGPTICMFNDFFNFCYPGGGYANDPTRYFNVEVPADQRVTFNWFAEPPAGADIRRYRWVMDLQDLTDETPRINEQTDWSRWSAYSLQITSATVGPFTNAPEDHLFFIEAEDNNGLRSLGIIRFTVVRATLEKPLLFVDDARLSPDQFSGTGQLQPPQGPWPTAAELDTFFFARGGVPWRGHDPPVLSVPGIFSAYEFDTMGTRGLPGGIVPLAKLGQYRLVVWYTDASSAANNTGSPFDPIQPKPSLKVMSEPGQPSTISTYLKQGGKLWLFGGGAAMATLRAWNKSGTPNFVYSNSDLELIPGRFMYDFAKWQNEIVMVPAQQARLNLPTGRGWSGHGMSRNLTQPDYGKLNNSNMLTLRGRTCATDPPPPGRFCDSFYLPTTYFSELISKLTFIREDADPDPDRVREDSTLDTLYLTVGTADGGRWPVMTYYHGFESPEVVFSGFPLWFFRRNQVATLADFVMQDIFKVVPRPGPAASGSATAARR